jgi:hypothetical protein
MEPKTIANQVAERMVDQKQMTKPVEEMAKRKELFESGKHLEKVAKQITKPISQPTKKKPFSEMEIRAAGLGSLLTKQQIATGALQWMGLIKSKDMEFEYYPHTGESFKTDINTMKLNLSYPSELFTRILSLLETEFTWRKGGILYLWRIWGFIEHYELIELQQVLTYYLSQHSRANVGKTFEEVQKQLDDFSQK